MSTLENIKGERRVPKLSLANVQNSIGFSKSQYSNFFQSLTSRVDKNVLPQIFTTSDKVEKQKIFKGNDQESSSSNDNVKGVTFYEHKKRGQSKYVINGNDAQKTRDKIIDEIVQQFSQTPREQKERQRKPKQSLTNLHSQQAFYSIPTIRYDQPKEVNNEFQQQNLNRVKTLSQTLQIRQSLQSNQIIKYNLQSDNSERHLLISQNQEKRKENLKSIENFSQKSNQVLTQSESELKQQLRQVQKTRQVKSLQFKLISQEKEEMNNKRFENDDYQLNKEARIKYENFIKNKKKNKELEIGENTPLSENNLGKEQIEEDGDQGVKRVSFALHAFLPSTSRNQLNQKLRQVMIKGTLNQTKSMVQLQDINDLAQNQGVNPKLNHKVIQEKKKLNEIKEKIATANLEETKQIMTEIDEQEKQLMLGEKKRQTKTKSSYNENIALTIDKNFKKKKGMMLSHDLWSHSQKEQAAKLIMKGERIGHEAETSESQNIFGDMYEENQERIQNLLKKTNPF